MVLIFIYTILHTVSLSITWTSCSISQHTESLIETMTMKPPFWDALPLWKTGENAMVIHCFFGRLSMVIIGNPILGPLMIWGWWYGYNAIFTVWLGSAKRTSSSYKFYRKCWFRPSIIWWLSHPSEKWWSSSVGIMTFPIWWESHKIHVPKHQPVMISPLHYPPNFGCTSWIILP